MLTITSHRNDTSAFSCAASQLRESSLSSTDNVSDDCYLERVRTVRFSLIWPIVLNLTNFAGLNMKFDGQSVRFILLSLNRLTLVFVFSRMSLIVLARDVVWLELVRIIGFALNTDPQSFGSGVTDCFVPFFRALSFFGDRMELVHPKSQTFARLGVCVHMVARCHLSR